MTLKVLLSAAFVGVLCSCGVIRAQSAPGGSAPVVSALYPMYWCGAGDRERDVNFGGVPMGRGKAVIFYEHKLGKFPRIYVVNGQAPFGPENGGIPQKTDWPGHLAKMKVDIGAAIPDRNWDGYAQLNFEAWEPIWETLIPQMKDLSRAWVRQRLPALNSAQVEARAKEEFEAAGMDFFMRTLRACQAERPNAKWGILGYPYTLHAAHRAKLQPIYDAQDVHYPCIYCVHYGITDAATRGRSQRASSSYASDIAREIAYSKSMPGNKPIMAVVWTEYHDINIDYRGQMLNDLDLRAMIREPKKAGAGGLIFWDYVNDQAQVNKLNAFFAGRGGQAFQAFMSELIAAAAPQGASSTLITRSSAFKTVVQAVTRTAPISVAGKK